MTDKGMGIGCVEILMALAKDDKTIPDFFRHLETFEMQLKQVENNHYSEQDKFEQYQEERRLFYVAMTRAKNNLYFFDISDRSSSFVEELFPCKLPL